MTDEYLKLLGEITGRIFEVVGKDKVKDYSKWQLQCLAFRIRQETEELQRVLDKIKNKPMTEKLKSFETFNVPDLIQLAESLNQMMEVCSDVKVITVLPAVSQFNQPLVMTLIELNFANTDEKANFEIKFKKTKLSVSKPT